MKLPVRKDNPKVRKIAITNPENESAAAPTSAADLGHFPDW